MTEERFNELVKKAQEKMMASNEKIMQTMLDEINAEEAAEVRECACNEDCECGCGPCCEHDCGADPDLTYEELYTILNEEAVDPKCMEFHEITMSYDDGFCSRDISKSVRVDFEKDASREETITAALAGSVAVIRHYFCKEGIEIDANVLMGMFMKVVSANVLGHLFKELF
jgi:hypothetical protein